MNLETEFRIRQQLQALERELSNSCSELRYFSCLTTKSEFEPSTWVKLRECPNPFSSDEALLLCQYSEEQWIAWVPDHGEILLCQHDFQRLDEGM